MVRNSYSSGRNDDRLANPNGKNVPQVFAEAGEEGEKLVDVLPCHQYSAVGNMNLNTMLIENIRSHDYFKGLSELTTFDEVVDQIYYDCSYVSPWRPGTHKAQRAAGMCSGLRGVSNAGLPSTAYMLLFKLYCLQLTKGQITRLINHKDSPYIRAIGFLYLRYACEPKALWGWFQPHIDDAEPISVLGSGGEMMTIGRYVRKLLTELEYYDTMLPRLPVPVMRDIEKKLAEYDGNSIVERPSDESLGGIQDDRPSDRRDEKSVVNEDDRPSSRSYHDLGSLTDRASHAMRDSDRAIDKREYERRVDYSDRRDRSDDRRRDSAGSYAHIGGGGYSSGYRRDDRRGDRREDRRDDRRDQQRDGRSRDLDRRDAPAEYGSDSKRARLDSQPPVPKAEAVKTETAAEKLARLRALKAARSGLYGGKVGGDYSSR